MTCKNQIKDFSQNNIKLFENIEKLCSQLRKIKSKHLLIEIVNLFICNFNHFLLQKRLCLDQQKFDPNKNSISFFSPNSLLND